MSIEDDVRRQMEVPVDPESFLFYSGVYTTAAHMTMGTQQQPRRWLDLDERAPGLYLNMDIALNRGMLAVVKEMRDQPMSEDVKHAMMLRLMHMGEIFGKAELKAFMVPGPGPGTTMVSEALLKACATARFVVSGDRAELDIADLARIAQEYTDAEDT